MPIIRMYRSEAEGIAEGAVNVRLSKSGGHDTWIGSTHVGLCIAERERNGRDDSDFYMTVWNEKENKPESILFATTRAGCDPCFGSRVDATPEVLAKYEAWKAAREAEKKAEWDAFAAKIPRKGKTVKVIKGRKVPIGTTGLVFWENVKVRSFFGKPGSMEGRVGIETPNGREFVSVENVELVEA